jgi:5'-nucleotidase
MHILVTNDDGVFAPGLLALAQALQPLGQVSILAPDRNWSASGHVKTLERPLRVKEVLLPGGLRAFASDGAPSDCVALGIMGVLDQPVDLVVSGINPNANVGHDVTYSGTVTAAMEGAINGCQRWPFSLDSRRENSQPHLPMRRGSRRNCPHGPAKPAAERQSCSCQYSDLPREEMGGPLITRQGLRIYRDALVRRADPRGCLITGLAARPRPGWRKKAPISAHWPVVWFPSPQFNWI